MNFAAALLAGGTSRRMRQDKAFLPLNGRPLWEHQLETLEALHPERLFISANSSQDFSSALDRAEILIDPTSEAGPLAAIVHCIEHTQLPTLVLAVDMPHITPSDLPTTPTVYEINGRAEPLAALYPPACLPLAYHELTHGKGALQPFVHACASANILSLLPAPNPSAFKNWNSPTDLQ